MNPEEAFLQAICENPDDDAPRLMYADWLTEHGDPRGEFIRLQCRAAKLPKRSGERKELERRAVELLEVHREEWVREDLLFGSDGRPVANRNVKPLVANMPVVRGFAGLMGASNFLFDTYAEVAARIPADMPDRNRVIANEAFCDLLTHRGHGAHDSFIYPQEIVVFSQVGFDPNLSMPNYGLPLSNVLMSCNRRTRAVAVETLLQLGAKPDAYAGAGGPHDAEYATNLHWLISEKPEYRKTAALLVRYGASTRIRNDEGLTVKQYLRINGEDELLRTIERAEMERRAQQKRKPHERE